MEGELSEEEWERELMNRMCAGALMHAHVHTHTCRMLVLYNMLQYIHLILQ